MTTQTRRCQSTPDRDGPDRCPGVAIRTATIRCGTCHLTAELDLCAGCLNSVSGDAAKCIDGHRLRLVGTRGVSAA